MGSKKEKNIVGLDLGSHSVKAVELKAKKGKGTLPEFELKGLGYEILPHDAIVEGTVIDTTAVADTIKQVLDENKISKKNVIISISGNSVIIKKIALPNMETEELAESIIWEAKHNIPYPYEETHVDYAILKSSDHLDEKNLDILLVAAKKEKISNYSNAISQARKNLVAVDVDVFALQNAYEVNYNEQFESKTVAIINIGANITNLIVIEKGHPQLFRDMIIGGSIFAENISKELSIEYDDAEKLLKGIPVENIRADQYQYILDMNIQNLVEEIEKTLSFYEAGDSSQKKVETIYLSGGLSRLTGLTGIVEQKFQTQTELFNPFRRISYSEKKFDGIYFDEMAPLFGVVTGLAIRTADKF